MSLMSVFPVDNGLAPEAIHRVITDLKKSTEQAVQFLDVMGKVANLIVPTPPTQTPESKPAPAPPQSVKALAPSADGRLKEPKTKTKPGKSQSDSRASRTREAVLSVLKRPAFLESGMRPREIKRTIEAERLLRGHKDLASDISNALKTLKNGDQVTNEQRMYKLKTS